LAARIPLARRLRSLRPGAGGNALPLRPVRLRICSHARARALAVERAAVRTFGRRYALLEVSFAKRLKAGAFWQKRYYDRNVRDEREFMEKLRYLHRNPVKAGLCELPEDWPWSSFRHYARREKGVVEIESEWTARDRERQATGSGERILLIPG